ncbi:MAG: hypothetical protein JWP38_3714 [Herbaspirillum sp.]|nr:hypothetical protein [Herbaspirillum sp.]
MNAHLFDILIALGQLKNDRALAERLRVDPQCICHIRAKRRSLGAALMIVINEVFDMPIAEQKRLMNMERAA